MASNQFLPFAAGGGANALTPTAYAALTSLLSTGFQAGLASSAQINTALRQASTVAAAVGEFIKAQGGDALDNGSATTLATALSTALQTLMVGRSEFAGRNQSLGASGYQKIPGGLIVQWGTYAIAAGAGTATITFPIAFPTACRAMVMTMTTTSYSTTLVVPSVSATSAQVDETDGSGCTVLWIAIGH